MQKIFFLIYSDSDLILNRRLILPNRLNFKGHICPENSDNKKKFTGSLRLEDDGEEMDK